MSKLLLVLALFSAPVEAQRWHVTLPQGSFRVSFKPQIVSVPLDINDHDWWPYGGGVKRMTPGFDY